MNNTTTETPEVTLLQHIHKGTVMGIESIRHLSGLSESVAFSASLNNQLQEYEDVRAEASDLLTAAGQQPQGISAGVRLMSDMTSNMKSMMDRSSSKLAEIMIQGSTMGTTNLVKELNDYQGSNSQVRALAQKLLKTEERNIQEMKKYL